MSGTSLMQETAEEDTLKWRSKQFFVVAKERVVAPLLQMRMFGGRLAYSLNGFRVAKSRSSTSSD
jgi:hypothetical protein